MLTSTLAETLLQLCPSHLRPLQTTNNARGDRQGNKATTKDAMHPIRKNIKMKKQNFITICK